MFSSFLAGFIALGCRESSQQLQFQKLCPSMPIFRSVIGDG
jgi:hypothetical protein